jgi:hypothetical protein
MQTRFHLNEPPRAAPTMPTLSFTSTRWSLLAAGWMTVSAAWAVDPTCKLNYPIVLSHMWSASPICSVPDRTGAKSCEANQDYARYCASKSTGADGNPKCLEWRVPDDEADLPPRDYNVNDPSLVREMRSYHRYFSKAIVSRLTDTCGNKVYIADKPPFASYAVRARVLRTTVLQALRETGAAKVNLIGMSQGVQDARYMTAVLPVDLANPNGPRMNTKVASVVSLVGEDGGTESAAIALSAMAVASGGNWANYPAYLVGDQQQDLIKGSWKKLGAPMDQAGQLVENCQGSLECDLSVPATQFKWITRSTLDLSPAFMRPSLFDAVSQPVTGWNALRQYVGQPDNSWSVRVPPSLEANNGVRYMSYGAVLRFPQPGWEHPETFYAVSLVAPENDSHVSLPRQQFANRAANFENLKVMRGALFTTGYHHTFFSGRNDPMYASTKAWEQEAAPYRGGSADFFQQMAREMRARGL